MTKKNYLISILAFSALFLSSCQETMEERAAREAKNYTRKYCPTPFVNYVRTDSVTFDTRTRTYTYHCTFSGVLDDAEAIETHRSKIEDMLRSSVRGSTSMKPYVEAGFHFIYLCRSESNPKEILVKTVF